MASLYTVLPIDEELAEMDSLWFWLHESGSQVPQEVVYGRYPSPREIRRVLDAMFGCHVVYTTTKDPLIGELVWKAEVSCDDDFTELWVTDFTGDEYLPQSFFFRRGEWLVRDIAQGLVNLCGSYLVIAANGDEPPFVLSPEA